MSRFVLLVVLVLALALGACSHSTPPATAAASSAPSSTSLRQALSPAAVAQAADAAKAADLPQPDYATPDSAYVPIDDATQLWALYAAISGMPPNYDQMAQDASSQYRETTDTFRKHDILAALRPKFDAEIAAAKDHRYITWTVEGAGIEHYDFKRHAFPNIVTIFEPGSRMELSNDINISLRVTNGQDFELLPVPDEATARTIEGYVGQDPWLRLRIFAFAQTTGSGNEAHVDAVITKVELSSPQGQLLTVFNAPH